MEYNDDKNKIIVFVLFSDSCVILYSCFAAQCNGYIIKSFQERKEEEHNDLQNSEIAKENAIYEAGIGYADEKSDNSNQIKSDCINLIGQDDVLEKATQQVIDDVEKRSPPYIERLPKENVPYILDDDGKNRNICI